MVDLWGGVIVYIRLQVFLFAGMGEAYPVPAGLIEVGQGRFRSEEPNGCDFAKIATQAAKAHQRAVPFFQQAFGLEPRQNYLLIAHRKQRVTKIFDLGESVPLTSEEMLQLILSLRPIARHLKGQVDLDAIEHVVRAHITRGAWRAAVQLVWNAIGSAIRSLPH